MRAAIRAAVALAVGSFGCKTNAYQTNAFTTNPYLTEPYFQTISVGIICQQLYAVDGNNQGWQQQTCGTTSTNLVQTRVLTAAEMAQVQAAFAALPAQQDPVCANDRTLDGVQVTLSHVTDTANTMWIACVNQDTVTQPYADAVTTLENLVGSPTFSGDQ